MNLSFVIPCFNEEEVIKDTFDKLNALSIQILKTMNFVNKIELMFVDDGSTDQTWELICGFKSNSNVEIRGVKLSRNFGHQHALLAGLESSNGGAVISVDADLQDDISVVPEMVRRFHDEGDQLVLGVRTDRSSDGLFKRVSAQTFYKILKILGDNTVPDHADFRLMSRKAIEFLSSFKDKNLYIRGVIPLLGLQTSTIGYMRLPRLAGQTKYSLRKMMSLAWNGVSNSSLWPLRAVTLLGVVSLVVTGLVAIWAVSVAIDGLSVPGWASTVAIISLLGGIQLLGIGVLGEYVGKILVESRFRPLYLVESEF